MGLHYRNRHEVINLKFYGRFTAQAPQTKYVILKSRQIKDVVTLGIFYVPPGCVELGFMLLCM